VKARVLGTIVVLCAYGLPAHATQVQLSYQSAASLGGPLYTTPAQGSGAVTTLAVPGTHSYGHDFGPISTSIPGTIFEFYDAYIFTIESAIANVLNATIALDLPYGPGPELALGSVEARLFALPNTAAFPWISGVGPPVTFDPPLIQAWSAASIPGVDIMVINPVQLNAGTYVLQVRGNVVGSLGGGYSGAINLAPVPLPAALPLLVCGLGGLLSAGYWRRRGLRQR